MHLTTPTIASILLLHVLSACAAEPADDDAAGGAGTGSLAGSSSSGGAPVVAGGSTSVSGSGVIAGSPSTAGAGGAPLPSSCAAVDPTTMLSDFETGVADVLPQNNRDGSWFVYNDKTVGATQTPLKVMSMPLAAEPGGACGSAYAFHTTGTGFNVWGAGVGMDFMKKVDLLNVAHDVSMYSGLALRAKAAATTPVRVSISDFNTSPEGKVCVDTTDATNKARCGDYFGAEIVLGPEYQELTIEFADMKQRGWGMPIATGFDKTRAYTIRMQVKGSAQAPATFDLWFDDIRLLP